MFNIYIGSDLDVVIECHIIDIAMRQYNLIFEFIYSIYINIYIIIIILCLILYTIEY